MDVTSIIDLNAIINKSEEEMDEDFIRLVSYPKADWKIFRKRIDWMLKHGVKAIILDGPIQIGKYHVMGKGTNSIVIKGLYGDEIVVVKILRLDASRDTLTFEAEIIRRIISTFSNIKLVPRLMEYTDWIIIQEYIEGVNIFDFLNEEIYHLDKETISRALSKVLYKGFLFDKINIDHGELSRPKSHVIFTEPDYEPVFIDFESAKYKKRPRNFSSLIQAIFIRHPSSKYLCELYDLDIDKIRKFVSIYNKSRTEEIVEYIISKIFNLHLDLDKYS